MKTKVKEHRLSERLTDDQARKLAGTLLDETDYNLLVTYDADIYCEKTGQ